MVGLVASISLPLLVCVQLHVASSAGDDILQRQTGLQHGRGRFLESLLSNTPLDESTDDSDDSSANVAVVVAIAGLICAAGVGGNLCVSKLRGSKKCCFKSEASMALRSTPAAQDFSAVIDGAADMQSIGTTELATEGSPRLSSCRAEISSPTRRRQAGIQSSESIASDVFGNYQSHAQDRTLDVAGEVKFGISEAERRHAAAASFSWVELGMTDEVLRGAAPAPACAICLAGWRPAETIRITPCGHVFHSGCFDPWLQASGTCGLCRNEIGSQLVQTATIPEAVQWKRLSDWSTSPWSPLRRTFVAPATPQPCFEPTPEEPDQDEDDEDEEYYDDEDEARESRGQLQSDEDAQDADEVEDEEDASDDVEVVEEDVQHEEHVDLVTISTESSWTSPAWPFPVGGLSSPEASRISDDEEVDSSVLIDLTQLKEDTASEAAKHFAQEGSRDEPDAVVEVAPVLAMLVRRAPLREVRALPGAEGTAPASRSTRPLRRPTDSTRSRGRGRGAGEGALPQRRRRQRTRVSSISSLIEAPPGLSRSPERRRAFTVGQSVSPARPTVGYCRGSSNPSVSPERMRRTPPASSLSPERRRTMNESEVTRKPSLLSIFSDASVRAVEVSVKGGGVSSVRERKQPLSEAIGSSPRTSRVGRRSVRKLASTGARRKPKTAFLPGAPSQPAPQTELDSLDGAHSVVMGAASGSNSE